MKLSKKSIYALRVLRHLAESYNKELLSASYLSRTEKISLKYLEQVLNTLRKGGFLVSTRGKDGGYSLRVPPNQISLGNVIRAIDGPLAPLPCASRTQPHHDPDCPYPQGECWLKSLMLRVRDNISEILDKETLADMATSAGGSGNHIKLCMSDGDID
ncbi:MAG: Rrf2 family transcriptional regulator [Planctomycetes bacterium]|nr:Rrf2 family transcriptional regulator [Planctomycetota bacterium]